jgi:hypothetical protein
MLTVPLIMLLLGDNHFLLEFFLHTNSALQFGRPKTKRLALAVRARHLFQLRFHRNV